MSEQKNKVMVWDPLVRIFHWSMAACFLVAYVTEDEWLQLHVAAGYTILGLILFRLMWGVIGTPHARFSDFVRGPQAVWSYMKDIAGFRARRYLGHNPAGGAMVVALLLCLTITGASGLLLLGVEEMSGPLADMAQSIPQAYGEWVKEFHEIFANLTLVLVILHLAGVFLAGFQHRENLVKSMVTGVKAESESEH